MTARRALVVLATVLALAPAASVQARTPLGAGARDLSFGAAGVVRLTQAGSGSDDVAIDRRGRILLASTRPGSLEVSRLDRDGRLDETFGVQGVARLGGTGFDGRARVLTLRLARDGRILVAGLATGRTLAVWALDADGRLDTTFGQGGLWATTLPEPGGTSGQVDAMALAPDGTIYVAVPTFPAPPYDLVGPVRPYATQVYALDRDGRPKAAFGQAGMRRFAGQVVLAASVLLDAHARPSVLLTLPDVHGGNADYVQRIDLDARGTVLRTVGARVAPAGAPLGYRRGLLVPTGGALVAIGRDGRPYRTFGTRGQATAGRGIGIAAVVRDAVGRLLVGVTREHPQSTSVGVRRLSAGGRLDRSFASTLVSPGDDLRPHAQRLTVDPRGRVLQLVTGVRPFGRDDYDVPFTVLTRLRARSALAKVLGGVVVHRDHEAVVRVRCLARATCRGNLQLGHGTQDFAVEPGRTRQVVLTVAGAGASGLSQQVAVLRLRAGNTPDDVGQRVVVRRR